jgi:hypothetical protein
MNILSKFRFLFHSIKVSRTEDKNNLPYIVMLFRLFYWLVAYRSGVLAFFAHKLHQKGHLMKTILSNREFFKIHDRLNPSRYRVLLEDKYLFDRFITSYNFPAVHTRGIIESGMVKWLKDLKNEPIDNIVNYNLDCFIKMFTSWGGSDVYRLQINNGNILINNSISGLDELKAITGGQLFVIHDTLIQHSELAKLNNSCVNTLRLITIHNGSRPELFNGFLRLGIRGSIVDNMSQGGLGIAVDENGVLNGMAFDMQSPEIWLTRHPETNAGLTGFRIPFYEEAVDLVIKAHHAFHCFFIIGWDIVITEKEPLLLEGNPVGDLMWAQAYLGQGMRSRVLSYADLFEKSHKAVLF